jgi:hypothetical protein
MPTIAWLGSIAILMYLNDHDPPHVHLRAPGFRARLYLDDLKITIMSGRMTPAEAMRLRTWVVANLAPLRENWGRIRRAEPPHKIGG